MFRLMRKGRWSRVANTSLLFFFSAAALADSPHPFLNFESTEGWLLMEGAGGLSLSNTRSSGQYSVEVGGAYWRKIASVPLATIGAPTNSLRIDVRPTQVPESWETIGVVIKVPSLGLWWVDLGTNSISGLATEHFTTIAFAIPEHVRTLLNGSYSDLELSLSINSRAGIKVDNLRLTEDNPPPEPPSNEPGGGVPPQSDGVSCNATSAVTVTEVRGSLGDLWAGREEPFTGKRAERDVSVGLSFSDAIDPSRLSAVFRPIDCAGAPIWAIPEEFANYWLDGSGGTATGLEVPGKFGIVASHWVSGISHSEAPIAAGLGVNLSNFSVNHSARRPVGIMGGAVTLSDGSLFGDVLTPTPYTLPSSVSATGGSPKLINLADFQSDLSQLSTLSHALDLRPNEGDVSVGSTTINLTGTDPDLNTFELGGSLIGHVGSLTIQIPQGASALINVKGKEVTFADLNLSLNGVTPNRLLWNAKDARVVSVKNIEFLGSILATNAVVDVRQAVVSGTVVARSVLGTFNNFRSAPLDAEALFGDAMPMSVTLRPSRQLNTQCRYALILHQRVALNDNGACLAEPFRVEFFVDSEGLTASEREIASIQSSSDGSAVHFETNAGINTRTIDVWSRYRDFIGLEASDLFAIGAEAHPVQGGGERRRYTQHVGGIPIFGFGYFVEEREGIFHSAFGRIVPATTAITLPATTLDENTAAGALLQHLQLPSLPWVNDPASYQAPNATLMWASKTGRPVASDLELRWVFDFARTGLWEPASAHVHAVTGEVTIFENASACFSETATPTGNVEIQSVTTNHNGLRLFSSVEYEDQGQFYSVPETAPQEPLRRARIKTQVTEDFGLCAVSDDGLWTSKDATEAATMFWGVQEAEDYLESLSINVDGEAWNSFDNGGGRPLETVWVQESAIALKCTAEAGLASVYAQTPTNPSSSLGGYIVANEGSGKALTNPAVMAHEYAHALLNWSRMLGGQETLVRLRESGAISEGFSDLFAVATIKDRIPDDPFWPCMPFDDTCFRNPGSPISTGFPDYYGLHPYIDYSEVTDADCGGICEEDNDHCGTHKNSTILSHWGYLLGTGSNHGDPVCGVQVEPLSSDENESYAMVVNIALNALARRVSPLVTFEELREATALVADELYPNTAVRPRIELAWHAVGVGDAPRPEDQFPADGQTGVEPWWSGEPRIRWKATDSGPWEIELSNQADFCENNAVSCVLESRTAAAVAVGGDTYAELHGKLEPDRWYHWRARPAGASSWEKCTIVARAKFKTKAKKISLYPYADNRFGHLSFLGPDSIETDYLGNVLWDYPLGADGFDVLFSDTEDPAECDSSDAVSTSKAWLTIAKDSFDYWDIGISNNIQPVADSIAPDEAYHLYARPFTMNGNEKIEAACQAFRVRHAPLGPFTGVSPETYDVVPVDLLGLEPLPELRFTKSEHATSYEVELFNHSPDATTGFLAAYGQSVYRAKREVGDCNVSESNGDIIWSLGGCDDDGLDDFLSMIRPGWYSWAAVAFAGGQYRYGWDADGAHRLSSFSFVPDHVPAEYFDGSEEGNTPAGRHWLKLKGDDIQPVSSLDTLETGVISTSNAGDFESVIYTYKTIKIPYDFDLFANPLKVEFCSKNDIPMSTQMYFAIESGGVTGFQSVEELDGSDEEVCGELYVDNDDWRVIVISLNALNDTASRFTELRVDVTRGDPPEPEPEPEPEPAPEPEPEPDCTTPGQVIMPAILAYGANFADQEYTPDPDDQCDVLRSYVFDDSAYLADWVAFTPEFEAVDHATMYELVVHPISFLYTLEQQECKPFFYQAELRNGYQRIQISDTSLPVSETYAYEFVIRAINDTEGCGERAGPWSELGALQIRRN